MPANPTLATLAADLEAGRTTARKLVEECLARIADPAGEGIRTFIHVDKDAALAAADAMILSELMPDLQRLGYMIEPFGKNTFVIQGTPADVEQGNEKQVIDVPLEQYKHFSNEVKFSKREILLRSVAWQQAVKSGTTLTEREMQSLSEELFTCEQPNAIPSGKPTYMEFKRENLEKMFGR